MIIIKKRKYRPYEEIFGEFKKIKSPIFYGEIEKGEEAEFWLLGMKKYFQLYNYSDELKAKWPSIVSLERNIYGGRI